MIDKHSPHHGAVYDPAAAAAECPDCGLLQADAARCAECRCPLSPEDRVRAETAVR